MRNLTLLTDFYQLTMMQGYFYSDKKDKKAVFDMFYRKNPDKNSFAIFAGLEQVIDYIENLRFNEEDIEYLKTFGVFQEEFLDYLRQFEFTGDIRAYREGSVILPYEPIIQVESKLMECQLVETAILNIVNHQSLIATKAQRVCSAAKDATVLEFGLRRAQGNDAGIYGARSAYIGGCVATSNVLAGKMFDIPVAGTHAHSWIMSFDNEYSAFIKYADLYPNNCILLVDTYNTLGSGLPNAIKVFNKLKEENKIPEKYGIRLDSGDLAYLSKECRKILDENGHQDALVTASNDLDEYVINDLINQGAKIDSFGVGTNMITSQSNPSFGGVYKISAIEDENGEYISKIKLSNNQEKITNPGVKKVFRIYSKKTGKVKADLITLAKENIDITKDLTIFDPNATWKKMTLRANEFTVQELLEPVFVNGERVAKKYTTKEIRDYALLQQSQLWDESKRIYSPQVIYVDLSEKLYELRQKLIKENS